MVTAMPFNQARKQLIREHAKKQEDDASGRDRLRSAKLTIKGATSLEPIYRFKLQDLAFNKANGRIKSEVIEREAELGRILDQFNHADNKILKEILLSIRMDENEKIKEDLRKNTQIFPGIITVDGVVINGNRRKALLEELYHETHDDRYNYLDAHILPSDITKSELWLIEAGIQLSAPQQLDYSPINHLLKLSEGLNSGLTIPEMASRIYGVTEEQLDSDIKRLDLINEYLMDFLGKEGKYYLVKNLNEHFINLLNILDWANRPRGAVRRDWIPNKDDINELKLVGFYYIRMHMPHLRIRDLRDIFATADAWKEAKRSLSVDPSLNEEEKKRLGVSHILQEEPSEDPVEKEEIDNSAPVSEQRDRKEELVWRESRKDQLKSIYEDAKEQERIVKDSTKPLTLAQRALRNIQAISLESCGSTDPEIDKVLSEIIALVNKIRKKVKK
jgi:hypothetical protein